jgi:hypothetical protein
LNLSGNISKNGLRVFVYLLGKLQYGNHIGVDQETIARDNGYSVVYIKKTISELKKANIVIPRQNEVSRFAQNLPLVESEGFEPSY